MNGNSAPWTWNLLVDSKILYSECRWWCSMHKFQYDKLLLLMVAYVPKSWSLNSTAQESHITLYNATCRQHSHPSRILPSVCVCSKCMARWCTEREGNHGNSHAVHAACLCSRKLCSSCQQCSLIRLKEEGMWATPCKNRYLDICCCPSKRRLGLQLSSQAFYWYHTNCKYNLWKQ